ncbi:hypothetical protein E2C01_101143 [Portunus trituberculatus]|uniref:Uncharacterized protein n=1 Tax=Portunus trituberculatus TaxID=210409 RepID=A0A5B7K9W4_PORTR|nr:hypothetical protein [Portunus trituberculatus]
MITALKADCIQDVTKLTKCGSRRMRKMLAYPASRQTIPHRGQKLHTLAIHCMKLLEGEQGPETTTTTSGMTISMSNQANNPDIHVMKERK